MLLEVLIKPVQSYFSQVSYDHYFCRGALAQSDYIVVSVPKTLNAPYLKNGDNPINRSFVNTSLRLVFTNTASLTHLLKITIWVGVLYPPKSDYDILGVP
jgi:hypothetical protein